MGTNAFRAEQSVALQLSILTQQDRHELCPSALGGRGHILSGTASPSAGKMFSSSARTTSDIEITAVPGSGCFPGPHGTLVPSVHPQPSGRMVSRVRDAHLPSCDRDWKLRKRPDTEGLMASIPQTQVSTGDRSTGTGRMVRAEEGERGAILKWLDRAVALCHGLVCGVLCFVPCCIQDG